ncbi:MAG: transglutaminase N-terminal domain-containing protein [Beijerinckiaceae bacterium]
MTIFLVRHVTSYEYARPVQFGEHRIMFRPRDSFDQHMLGSSLNIDPAPSKLRWTHDVFGNCIAIVTFQTEAPQLTFTSQIRLDHTPDSAPAFETAPEALDFPFAYSDEEAIDLEATRKRQYSDEDDEVGRWARQFGSANGVTRTGELLMTLCSAIHEGSNYRRRVEAGTQTPLETLRTRQGTCRDFAVLMMEAVRSLGFASRFVTGYIYVEDRDGPTMLGGGSTHAWCQVFMPGAGWVEFDPTNGIVGNRDLIRVGVARSPSQALPLSGTFFGRSSDYMGMSVQVNVTTERSAPAPPDRIGSE